MANKKKLTSPLLLKYQSVFDKDPRSRVFAPLAECYRKLGLTDKALEILKKGIKNHPGYALGYLCLAHCYFDQEKFEQCVQTLRPLIPQNLENMAMQRLFAKACLQLSYFDEALETFKYLLFLNPKDELSKEEVKKLEGRQNGQAPFETQKLEKRPFIHEDQWVTLNLTEGPPSAGSKGLGPEMTEFLVPEEEGGSLVGEKGKEKERGPMDFSLAEEEAWPEEEPNKDPLPVVTHTLVDLYCAQGHFHKGVEVLEKILALNPQDKKTADRLFQLREQMACASKKVSQGQDRNDSPSGLRDCYQIFLKKIKERASHRLSA